MKLFTVLSFLFFVTSCVEDNELSLIKEQFNSKTKKEIEKLFGANKFSKSYIDYIVQNTKLKVKESSEGSSDVKIEVLTLNNDIAKAAMGFAMGNDRNKVTIDDMLNAVQKKGFNVDKLSPQSKNFTCKFKTNEKQELVSCGF